MARTKKKVKYNYQKVAVILCAVLLFFTFIVGLSNAPFPKAGPDPWDPNTMGGISSGGAPTNPNLATHPTYLTMMLQNTMRFLTTGFTGFNPPVAQPATCISDNQSCNNGAGTCQRIKRTSCESASHGNGNDANADAWQEANRTCRDFPSSSGCSDFKKSCNEIGRGGRYDYDQFGNIIYKEGACNSSNVAVNGEESFQACKFSMVDVMQDGKPKYECKPQVVIAHTCSTILNYKECNFGVGLRLGCTWEEIASPTCNGPYCPVYFRAPEPAGRCVDKPKEIDRCRSIETMKECEFGVGEELGCSWTGALPGGPEACYSSDNLPA